MKAVLIRTGSGSVQSSPIHGSPKVSIAVHDSVTGILFPGKNVTRCSLHLEINDKRKKECSTSIRRTMSESDVIRSVNKVPGRFPDSGSRSFPARILEDEENMCDDEEGGGGGGSFILKKKGLNLDNYEQMTGIWRESGVLEEFSGGGIGKGRHIGGGNGGGGGEGLSGGNADQSNMSEYYQELLKANPGNPLILRNYGKYLHEVKGDIAKAEECYSRAILLSPGDGEVLSLYGKLIWESCRDEERAESYFDQAIQASPDDCYVMGSYANFLWSAEEEEEETSEVKLMALVEAC